jgi:hypothetical protein
MLVRFVNGLDHRSMVFTLQVYGETASKPDSGLAPPLPPLARKGG